jgi:hypothetical protein
MYQFSTAATAACCSVVQVGVVTVGVGVSTGVVVSDGEGAGGGVVVGETVGAGLHATALKRVATKAVANQYLGMIWPSVRDFLPTEAADPRCQGHLRRKRSRET